MTSCVDLHSQLVTIMDVLAKAAVADICKLVDDGYAVLRLEISRRQKENQTLKKRLQILELMIERGYANPEDDQFPDAARFIDSQPEISPWRVADPAAVDKFSEEPGQLELQFIKEERLDGDLQHEDLQHEDLQHEDLQHEDLQHEDLQHEDLQHEDLQEAVEKGVVMLVPIDGGNSPSASEDRAGLSGHQRMKRNVWDDNGGDSVLKAEPANDTVTQRPQFSASECSAMSLNSLPYEYVTYVGTSQAKTFYHQSNVEPDREEEPKSHVRPFPVTKVSGSVFPPLQSSNVKPVSAAMSSVSIDMETEVCPTWNKEPVSENAYVQQRRYKEHKGDTESQSENVNGNQMNRGESVAEPRSINVIEVRDAFNGNEGISLPKIPKTSRLISTKEKSFICTYCGKCFSCPNRLKTHRRIHTGEKPFSCNQCGKRFSDSSNVKRHQNTHTGKKPFICTLCGRGFSQSGCLITHQRVHTGEKPFSCAQCGKRFSDSSNLKRHQNTHIVKKACSCLH